MAEWGAQSQSQHHELPVPPLCAWVRLPAFEPGITVTRVSSATPAGGGHLWAHGHRARSWTPTSESQLHLEPLPTGASLGPPGLPQAQPQSCHLPPLRPPVGCAHTIQGPCLMQPPVLGFRHRLPEPTRCQPAVFPSLSAFQAQMVEGPLCEGPTVSPGPEAALSEPRVLQKQLLLFPAAREAQSQSLEPRMKANRPCTPSLQTLSAPGTLRPNLAPPSWAK